MTPALAEAEAGLQAGVGHLVAGIPVRPVGHGARQELQRAAQRVGGRLAGVVGGAPGNKRLRRVAEGVHPGGRRNVRGDRVGEGRIDQRRPRIDERADHRHLVGTVRQHHHGVAGYLGGRSGCRGNADGRDPRLAQHLDADPVLGHAAVRRHASGDLGGVHRAAAAHAQHHAGAGLADGLGAGVHAGGGRLRLHLVPDFGVDARPCQFVGHALDHPGLHQALVGHDQRRAVGDPPDLIGQFVKAAASEDDGGRSAERPAIKQVGHSVSLGRRTGHYLGKLPTMPWTAARRIYL